MSPPWIYKQRDHLKLPYHPLWELANLFESCAVSSCYHCVSARELFALGRLVDKPPSQRLSAILKRREKVMASEPCAAVDIQANVLCVLVVSHVMLLVL